MQPKDIENFALASKTIRTLGGKILREHRSLTSKYSTFSESPKSKVSPAGLLKEILTNPRVALYVKNFTVSSRPFGWEDDEEEGVNTLMGFDPEAGQDGRRYRHTPYLEKDMEMFTQILKKAVPFLPVRIDVRIFVDFLRNGREHPIILLLILVLPNLQSLIIDGINALHFTSDSLLWLDSSIVEGTELPIRPINVKLLCISGDEAAHSFRTVVNEIGNLDSTQQFTPVETLHDRYLEYHRSLWGMDVNEWLPLDL